MGEQIVVPKAEFIEDVAKFMDGKTTDVVLASLAEQKKRFKIVENSVMQKKARLMTKLPEIQKAYDIVTTLLEKASQPDQEAIIDYELADAVYARTKVTHVKTVNLWLGAGIMVEYSLEEAKELLANNLENCKANLKTCDHDLGVINDNITTIEVSQSRVWNHDVEKRRLAGKSATAAAGGSS